MIVSDSEIGPGVEVVSPPSNVTPYVAWSCASPAANPANQASGVSGRRNGHQIAQRHRALRREVRKVHPQQLAADQVRWVVRQEVDACDHCTAVNTSFRPGGGTSSNAVRRRADRAPGDPRDRGWKILRDQGNSPAGVGRHPGGRQAKPAIRVFLIPVGRGDRSGRMVPDLCPMGGCDVSEPRARSVVCGWSPWWESDTANPRRLSCRRRHPEMCVYRSRTVCVARRARLHPGADISQQINI